MRIRQLLRASLFLFACNSSFAQSSCQGWDPDFSFSAYAPAPDGPLYATAIFDDGSGPKLYVGGAFGRIGNTLCRSIARWDGTEWSSVGGSFSPNGSGAGIAHAVYALAVYDDGSGPALFAGGHFSTGPNTSPTTRIARFDGTNWSVPGGGISGEVHALAVHDDGSGAKLFVGGNVSAAGGQPVTGIVGWNGTSWSTLGTGIGGVVRALTVFDEGTGPKLFAGGRFPTAGGTTVSHIARWDGSSWSALDTGVLAPPSGGVYALRVHDDGAGSKLYAGGYYLQAGGQNVFNIARWDGIAWSGAGSGVSGDIRALESFDDGSGTKLYAGGSLFVSGQPEYGFYRWDGASWSGVGAGVVGGPVETLIAHDDGTGTRLFLGGAHSGTGTLPTGGFSAWSAAGWSLVGETHGGNGVNGHVMALAAHDDGSGPALFAGGYFGGAGGQNASEVARWNGSGWSALGSGLSNGAVRALASFDDGSGSALFAGGEFLYAGSTWVNHVARWDGTSWGPVAAGLGGAFAQIVALEVFDDGLGPALFAAGTCSASFGVPMLNIARWDGTSWSALGSGVGTMGDSIRALAVFDDGSGPALYAGGRFGIAGGVPVNNIARWDGTSWSALGSGVGTAVTAHSVNALRVFDDGSGPALFAGGYFDQAGGVAADALARWDGTSWSAVPGALAPGPSSSVPEVYSLRVVDDGSGPALSVGGRFSAAGSVLASSLARWNGLTWSGVDGGVGDSSPVVLAQEFFDDGSGGGADLYVGGGFFSAGGYISSYLARWNSCAEIFESFCAGDGTSVACPCANSGQTGRGCENSAATGGARLEATGIAGNDSIELHASGMLPSALAIFLQGQQEVGPVPFGDGLRCVAGSLKRLYVLNASGGAASVPQAGDPSIRTRSAALGDPILQGASRRYQTYYRDPDAGFCPAPQGSTFNVTNGLRIRW